MCQTWGDRRVLSQAVVVHVLERLPELLAERELAHDWGARSGRALQLSTASPSTRRMIIDIH